MNHIDLFSGIGGFALAARVTWGDEYHNILFCDNNEFCQQVIRKNFGEKAVIYGDIREVGRRTVFAHTADAGFNYDDPQGTVAGDIAEDRKQSWSGRSGCVAGCDSERQRIDLITGGFPCQPFSCAGQQRGKEDDRYLWDEMFRVINEFKPRWIVGENVAGIISMAQQQGESIVEAETDTEEGDDRRSDADGILCEILDSLERIGYIVQTFVIPACAVNAPHRRDRVWIIARRARDVEDPICVRSRGRGEGRRQVLEVESPETEVKRPDSESRKAGEGGESSESGGQRWREAIERCQERWTRSWLEVAAELCRVDDGISAGVDRPKYSASKHRAERLKALGNSIVPHVAIEIFNVIKEVDEQQQV